MILCSVTQALIMGSVSIANSLAYAPNFYKGMIAAAKINQLLQRTSTVADPIQNEHDKILEWEADGNVQFQNTEFFYQSRPSSRILQELNLSVRQGQTVALVGASGCGKSTCIQLLVRFYDVTGGMVEIDEKDIRRRTKANLRSQIGIVSQEPALFDRTIAENIGYGDNSRDISKADIIEAAKQANIHNFVASLPLVC